MPPKNLLISDAINLNIAQKITQTIYGEIINSTITTIHSGIGKLLTSSLWCSKKAHIENMKSKEYATINIVIIGIFIKSKSPFEY